jgi:3-hydroxyacyl-CoA dehydrogenase
MEHRLTLIRPSLDLGTVGTADLIVEAVFEKLEVKQELFGKLDTLAKPGAVLATNTSYLNVDKIAAATGRAQDVLGMHFFSPANVMRLLEVVRAAKTADDALKTALAVGRQLGKVAVVAGVCDGFIGNRMLRQYQRQTYYMLEDGALPQEIDATVTGFGFAMGPFAVYDLAGLDISYANRRREDATRDPAERYVALPDKLVELGRLGQKSGAGWYRYEKGSRSPHRDPVVEGLIFAAAKEKGIERRAFSQEEILTRLLTALVNEGAKILGEGIALRAVDIDMVWINGYGFPAHEGGPLFWAEQRGLAKVLADVEGYAKEDAWAWRPAPLLVQLVREGKSFRDVGAA